MKTQSARACAIRTVNCGIEAAVAPLSTSHVTRLDVLPIQVDQVTPHWTPESLTILARNCDKVLIALVVVTYVDKES